MPEVGNPQTMRLRMLSEKCSSCILRPARDGRILLSPDRLKEFIDTAVETDSYVVCHSTLYREDVKPAICRGFADAYDTRALRMGRLLGFEEVPPPAVAS